MDTRALYTCSQRVLYLILRLGWTSYGNFVALFTAMSAYYTALLGTSRLTEVDVCEALPDFQARNSASQVLRTELLVFKDLAIQQFNYLKSYIMRAYAPELWDFYFEEAGEAYYNDAAGNSFTACQAMLASMIACISAHSVELLAAGYMPVAFSTQVSDNKTDFDAKFIEYENSREAILTATEAKLTANNNAYVALTRMFADAQLLAGLTEAQKKQFNFSYLQGMVSAAGASGIGGFITDDVGVPIAGVTVEVAALGRATLSNADGFYELNLPAGTYSVDVTPPSASSFLPQTLSVTVNEGVIVGLSIELTS